MTRAALLAPYAALIPTAAIAAHAPLWTWLAAYISLSFLALMLLSAVWAGKRRGA